MIATKADLSLKEVSTPQNRWCASGHEAPEKFQRNPPNPEELTRFFHVSASDRKVNGTYCELCLIVAGALSRGEVKPL